MKELFVPKGECCVETDDAVTLVAENIGASLCLLARDESVSVLGISHMVVPGLNVDHADYPCFDSSAGLKRFFKMLVSKGAKKESLDLWLVGAARFMECPKELDIGAQLYSLLKKTLKANNMDVKGEHVGGPYNRSVRFTSKGPVMVKVKGVTKEIAL